MKKCKYLLPCGRCDQRGAPCDATVKQLEIYDSLESSEECGHNWVLEEQETIKQKVSYKRYKCRICGKEKIIRIEFQDDGLAHATSWEKT